MDWSVPPTADEVKGAMDAVVAAEALLRAAKEEMEVMVAFAQKARPRTAWVTILGANEEDTPAFLEKRKEIRDLEKQVAEARNDLKFISYRQEMYKTWSYNNRY